MLLNEFFFLSATFCFIFSCLCVFAVNKLNFFEAVCVVLAFVVCIFGFFQNNLFYVLFCLEILSLIYSFLIASGGVIRKAVLYTSLSFAVATAMAALVPHDLSLSVDNIDFLHRFHAVGEVFVGLLFVFSGGLLMAPLVVSVYPSTRPLLLPFLTFFLSNFSLVLIAKIAIGYSWLLFVLSVLTIIYAFFCMLFEERISNLFVAYQIAQIGLIGVILCFIEKPAYYYISLSALCQMVFYLVSSILFREGIGDLSCLQRYRISCRKILFVLFLGILLLLALPMSSIVFANTFTLQPFGLSVKVMMVFLSSLFTFIVPLRVFFYCCSGSGVMKSIRTTVMENFCIYAICIYFFFIFSSGIYYDQYEKFVPMTALLAAGLVYALISERVLNLFSRLRVLFQFSLFPKTVVLRLKKGLLFLMVSIVENVFAFFSSLFLTLCNALESFSLSFIVLLVGIFVVLFLSLGV